MREVCVSVSNCGFTCYLTDTPHGELEARSIPRGGHEVFFLPFFTYILQSQRDGSFYVGFSHNPTLRCQRHNDGGTRSTRAGRPWRIMWTRQFSSKSEALAFERHLKKMKSRTYLEKLLRNAGGRPDP